MGTSLSPQAGMGGPSQGEFTPLSQLTLGCHSWSRIRVRVSRIWVASDPLSGKEYGLDSLLIDDDGVVMQARAHPYDMKRLKHQLVEGKVYALSNFRVDKKLKYYMACSNDLMIIMGAHTVVGEINDHRGSLIPRHSFKFVDFGDVRSRNKDRSLLTDVIGQIVSIEDEGQAWKWEALRNISFRNIHLRDSRGAQLNVALYGELGRNFDAEHVFKQDRKDPIVAIFAGMLVQHYKGFTVRSTSASKYYLDLDVKEVQKFRASLDGPHTPIDRLPCQLQNPVNPAELANSWRTVKQLASLNPHELQPGSWFLCTATFKGIDCTEGWSYLSCFHCHQSISWVAGWKSLCIKGCPNNMPPVRLYKLNALMEDATGIMNIMIFDKPARKLVGVSAELIEGASSEEISATISSHQSRTVVVAVYSGGFLVQNVLLEDNDALQLNISDETEAGDGSELSQDEGSSVSCISSSEVKKEKIVVKEETEAGGGDELLQDEGSCASCSPSPVKKVKKEEATEEGREPKRQKCGRGNEAEQTDSDRPPSPINFSSQKN